MISVMISAAILFAAQNQNRSSSNSAYQQYYEASGPSREHPEGNTNGENVYIIACTIMQTAGSCVCGELPGAKGCSAKPKERNHGKLPPPDKAPKINPGNSRGTRGVH